MVKSNLLIFIKQVASFKKALFLIAVLFVFLTSCTRMPDVQGNGDIRFQGVWAQDSIANSEQLLSYTHHQFKFTCDSFYVDLTTHSKVNYYEEDCFQNGVWKEYAKGTYQVKGDTLRLNGTFTKSNYKQKISGCYRNGQYITNFKIKSTSKDKLQLEGIKDNKECILTLKQEIVCVPKSI